MYLFDKISDINTIILTKDDDYIEETLLLGQMNFDDETNKSMLEATIDFIINTKRFDCPLL